MNKYPGRGIVLGQDEDGKLVAAYFIMGRSANSRNRVLEVSGGDVFTKAADESKVEDPRLIIYRALAQHEDKLVVTNGDQTDTVMEYLAEGKTFEEALSTREYEPDHPNYTPRISGIAYLGDGKYTLSILKREDGKCVREYFNYSLKKGVGHLIHTYMGDGNPLPTFLGAPKEISLKGDICKTLWDNLDEDNRISIYIRFIDLNTLDYQEKVVNKYERI
ncbi:MAG: IMP cyclohydrolase [Clostridia bacterium]|nr:IMP cyclohydrolase [Clostridia bacterium]